MDQMGSFDLSFGHLFLAVQKTNGQMADQMDAIWFVCIWRSKNQMAKWRIKWASFGSFGLVEQIKCAFGSSHLVWSAKFKWPKGRRLVHLVWSAKPNGGSNERHLVHLVWSIKSNGGSNGRHLIHLVWGNKPNGAYGHYLIHWVWRAKRQMVK